MIVMIVVCVVCFPTTLDGSRRLSIVLDLFIVDLD